MHGSKQMRGDERRSAKKRWGRCLCRDGFSACICTPRVRHKNSPLQYLPYLYASASLADQRTSADANFAHVSSPSAPYNFIKYLSISTNIGSLHPISQINWASALTVSFSADQSSCNCGGKGDESGRATAQWCAGRDQARYSPGSLRNGIRAIGLIT